MDSYMEYYFEDAFSRIDRDGLSERYKRREMVEYFSNIITACAKGQDNSEDTSCSNFVRAALRYHNACKAKNGNVCLMGKYHNLLYVAMKLAFDCGVQDNGTVSCLLDELYACEGTFERIFLGAIFGTSAPHFLAGWKSDFKDKEENVSAMVFFLHHATQGMLEYSDGIKSYRFLDVPLESCGKASPVRVAIQMGAAEMLMILLRFGAQIPFDNISSNPVETILDRLKDYNRKYPYELVTCLKLVLRAIPTIKLTVDKNSFKHLELPQDYNYQRKLVLENYFEILEDHLIPSSRCGLRPVELKHLARCVIREALWKNFELPGGIRKLPIPIKMMMYLDLIDD